MVQQKSISFSKQHNLFYKGPTNPSYLIELILTVRYKPLKEVWHWYETWEHKSSCTLLKYLSAEVFVGWLVGCLGFNGPLRQYFSLYQAVSQREEEREEKRIDESKNVQTNPTRTYYKRSRPSPYCNPNCRTPRHWKFTQHHRTTRPPPLSFFVNY